MRSSASPAASHESRSIWDENSASKGGAYDKRCMMEARLDGRPPIAVTQQAATLDAAMDGAAAKLERSIDSMLGRLRDR